MASNDPSEPSIPSTPAGRLRILLSRASEVRQDQGAAEGWASVFGVDLKRDRIEFSRRVAAIVNDGAIVRRAINSLDSRAQRLLRHYEEVENTLDHFNFLSESLSWFLSTLHETGLHSLELCEAMLGGVYFTYGLPTASVARIRALVDRLLDQIESANDLDVATRSHLHGLALDILIALRMTDLHGVEPLAKVVNGVVGEAMRDPSWLTEIKKSSVWKGFAAVVIAADLALNVASNASGVLGLDDKKPALTPVVVTIFDGDRESEPGSITGIDSTRQPKPDAPPIYIHKDAGSDVTPPSESGASTRSEGGDHFFR